MFWHKKKTPLISAPVRPFNGFMTTDNVPNTDESWARAAAAIKHSIQRTAENLKAVNNDGTAATFAMDEAYQDLQLVKAQNSGLWGGFLPAPQLEWYANQAFVGYQVCALLSQQWLVNKACNMPAKDAVRHGWDMTINDGSEIDPEIQAFITERDKAFRIKKQCVEMINMNRIFGIRHALFEVETGDPNYYLNPFNIDAVRPGSYKGISQIDPYWISPELDIQAAANPASRHFYEPTWWRVNGVRIHRSHFIIARGSEVPDILKPTYFYGGISIPQKIAERVWAAERTANEAPMLAMTKRLITFQTDIDKAMANSEKFIAKLQNWTAYMNNFGIKAVGEDEEVQTHDTSLTDLDETIMTQFQLVAAASEVPATKLLGTSPKGFGASGEYEESSYHEMLESYQEDDLSPLVNRHHELLIKSEVMPKFGVAFFATDTNWRPTDTPTAAEAADINLKKAQTDTQWVQAGAIDGTDIRQRLIADRDSGYNGIQEVVPEGPGDRDHEHEMEEKAMEGDGDDNSSDKA
jgi:phage-related protein (TIGR01555 family)